MTSSTLERRRKTADGLRGLTERRSLAVSGLEIRQDTTDGIIHFTGYASLTDQPYDVGGMFTETIRRGAFKRTLNENPDVQLLVNHGGLPLARTKSGTMTLAEDQRGLWVGASLDAEDPDVLALARKMRRGDIDQMSMAFQVTDQVWSADYTDRVITTLSLHRGDVSVVNQGANPATSASVRTLGNPSPADEALRAPLPDYTTRAIEQLARLRAGRR